MFVVHNSTVSGTLICHVVLILIGLCHVCECEKKIGKIGKNNIIIITTIINNLLCCHNYIQVQNIPLHLNMVN